MTTRKSMYLNILCSLQAAVGIGAGLAGIASCVMGENLSGAVLLCGCAVITSVAEETICRARSGWSVSLGKEEEK